MNKKTKFGLGAVILAAGVLAMAGCTSSFCSTTDKAHIAAAYDNGVCAFYNADNKPENAYELTTIDGISDVYFTYSYANNNGGITKAMDKAKSSNIDYPTSNCEYWAAFDLALLKQAYEKDGKKQISGATAGDSVNQLLDQYRYLKFYTEVKDSNSLWDNWSTLDKNARNDMVTYAGTYGISYQIDKIPSADFVKVYKNNIETTINNFRGCITTNDGQYGAYGWEEKTTVAIEGKDYSYAWSKGFFEGLLVYPIGALVDVMCNAFQGLGNGLNGTNGWAQLVTILLVTLIVRVFMFIISFKSTMSNAKMNELQPQIAKIQAKYPNANSSQTEKARMADEMNKLYKKNKINPFASLIVMIFQFPIFICVWGAFTGSSWLATGQFLGMNFSDSISSVLFNGANWVNGSAWTALVTFILMAASQVFSMLIPQMIQKKKQQSIAKTGKNPAQAQQGKTMKIVTWVMMIMIIFMGFSLASAMGIYWFIGALISIAQTLITQKIMDHKTKKEK